VALSLSLLTAAGLLTRGILHAHQMDLGFDASRVGSARIAVPKELYTRAALSVLWSELDDRLAAAPVGTTARTNVEPLDDSPFVVHVRKPGESDAWDVRALQRQLSPAGFPLLRLAFVSGSAYSDRPEVREAVINQTLARQLGLDGDPIGRTLLADDQQYRITGVVRDSYYTTPTEIRPVLFRAPELTASRLLFRLDEPGAAAALEGIVKAVEPRLGVTIVPVTTNIEAAVRAQRGIVGLVWAVGLLGLILATVGVFGVFAYAVEERRREIGVRLALGARARDIYRVLFDVNRWSVGAGLTAGLILSAIAGFLLRSYLFGLHPLDPVAYLAVSVLIGCAAMVAVTIPARRALRVDPAVTLKGD